MFQSNRILTIDVGASKVVLAEFAIERGSAPRLSRYGISHLDIDPENDTHTSALLVSALRDLMREQGIKPAPLYFSISGQTVFPRFVTLPPVSKDKIYQIVRYEAEQNVPFPIDEVVWDYQLLPGKSATETNVMLIAVKTENVIRLTDCVQAAHLEPHVVDAAPLSLYNTVRYNYPDEQGCTLVLDIGARSSNLIFVEQDRIFSRSVPVAGNSITQEMARQFGISFEEAEEAKKAQAEVDLGGNYEGPEDDTAQQIAKIVRTVMTRLHAEVNRSINFYRSQQDGSAPERVLLTGGSSMMQYTDVFFEDKLKIPVQYLNPFLKITVDPSIDEERIGAEIHLLSEVTGLALRHATTCPIEINLMPPDLVALKTFRRRQPFFAASAICLVMALLAFWLYAEKAERQRAGMLGELQESINVLRAKQGELRSTTDQRMAIHSNVVDVSQVIDRRFRWISLLDTIHGSLLDGMWLTGLDVVRGQGAESGRASKLVITGSGFKDQIKKYETTDATPLEVFRNRLRATDAFQDSTDILEQPLSGREHYLSEFKIRIDLEEPIIL